MNKIIVLFLLLSMNLFSQEKLSFEFDYARFNIDSNNKYLEIYYSLGQRNLKQHVDGDKNCIGAYLDIKITDTFNNKIAVNKRYKSRTEIDSSDSTFSEKNLLGKLGYTLSKGLYNLEISATDIADTTNFVLYNEKIEITNVDPTNYAISDIQLATRIVSNSENKESIFYKNTMEIFPNAHSIYTEKMPVLFFYCELYNLDSRANNGKEVTLIQQLKSTNGRSLKAKYKTLSTKNSSIVEAGIINLKKYPTGSYILTLSIFEDSSDVGISSSKRFYLINESVKVANTYLTAEKLELQSSEYGIMSEEECDELFLQSIPLARKVDTDTYKELKNVDGKRKFLFDFWLARDQKPETQVNEFKEEYKERVDFVENRFRTFVSRGIETERGRVYLQFGEPDEMDQFPSEYNMKPYESWFYNNIEGGVFFIFGDVSGYGNYELLHSTKRGELRDDAWQRRITVD